MRPIRVLVLSSTRKERDGIAEYTRQVFRPEFQDPAAVRVQLRDITPANILRAPFQGAHVLHIQHEFFLFDRCVGASVLLYYPYLWLASKLVGCRLVTTFHSTYNVADLAGALPHFRRYRGLFPLGSLYLRCHMNLVLALSTRVIILSKIGLENIGRVMSPAAIARKVRYTHLGNYASPIRLQSHGLLAARYGIPPADPIFTLFGFAFPIKGYEYGIEAMNLLVHQRQRTHARLVIVSGETGKGSFPGGGQGGSYIGWLKHLAAQRGLEQHVLFTGYLANNDPLLEEIFDRTLCFVFPYLDRHFPSGAISTTLATGKPMLVSRIRCFQEYDDLLTFPEKDAAGLAARLEQFMDDPALVARAAAITRHNAEKFSMDRIFARHLEIYREALGTR
ncbi:MAG: glycosyltransferase family 4 protein [Verrucomicrobia bacterium]|nr:glycosyltransferase family 4 protein [Verrucomicrobiota bacterium]